MSAKVGRKLRALFARWIRPLGHMWKPFVWMWGAIIVGTGINVCSSWLTTQTTSFTLYGTPLGWVVDPVHFGITLPLVGTFILLTCLAGLAHRETARQMAPASQQRRHRLRSRDQRSVRQYLLEKVRETWITNVLEHSLHHAAWIDLHLQDQPDALENPWQFVVQELNTAPRSLPTGTNIFQIYDDSQGQLLILGEPGAGKTTLLLQLARTLLDLAKDDERRLLPVVFQLSTWAAWARAARKRNSPFSFGKWLIDELELRYGVPLEVANQWVEGHQLVFLLDGLDEVAAEERSACVEAIIAYQRDSQSQVTTNLALCCRSQEFEELVRPLPLFTAVNILPLSDEQVDAYLSSAQGQLDGLRHLLQINAEFAELARRPLVLSIATKELSTSLLKTISPPRTIFRVPALLKSNCFRSFLQPTSSGCFLGVENRRPGYNQHRFSPGLVFLLDNSKRGSKPSSLSIFYKQTGSQECKNLFIDGVFGYLFGWSE